MKILLTLIVLLFSITSFAKTYTFILEDERTPHKPFVATINGLEGVKSFEQYLVKGHVLVQENGDPQMGIFNGLLRRRMPSPTHQWHFEFVPEDLQVVDFATEVCDAQMQFIEDNLDQWLADVGRWCPFGTTGLVQKIFRNKTLIYDRGN